jgi:Icc protein
MAIEDTGPRSRRHALECMLWAGTGLVWSVAGGIPRAAVIGSAAAAEQAEGLRFMQISDSHIGFSAPPNTDVAATLQDAVRRVRDAERRPALLLHTGDVTHLSKPAEFDLAAQLMAGAGVETFTVPGEHDLLQDDGRGFYDRFAPRARPGGWMSFDHAGVHFLGLNNVVNLEAGGLGQLGAEQLRFIEQDLQGRSASTPIVVFAHIPLWTVHAPWGWGTADAAQALGHLARFGSVTVLNGHIHQVMQKVEGKVAFHTAMSTAFPQPAPGTAPNPGPIRDLPAGRLRAVLGVTTVAQVPGQAPLAIIDSPLV